MAQHRILVQLSATEQRLLSMLTARQQCQHLPSAIQPTELELRAWAPMDGPDAAALQGFAPQSRDGVGRKGAVRASG